MSLDKAIKSGKEKRCNRVSGDRSCRPHGGCAYCEARRTFARRKVDAISKLEVREFEKYGKEVA